MIPLGVIMFTEICQDAPQREFAEQNEPGKTFALDRTYPPLRKRIQIGAARRQSQALHTSCGQGLPEFSAELRIAVVEHVPMLAQTSGFLVNRIAGHLRHPLFGRVPRDAC
jgi:hypothetical protein